MIRSPATHTTVTILVIVGLAALLILVPASRGGTSHGGAVGPRTPGTTMSVFDRPTPPVSEGTPDPNVPRTVEDLRAVDANGSRCAEGDRRIFVLFYGDSIADVSHVDEVVRRQGSVEVPLAPGRSTRGLPLDVLIAGRPGTETVELWPCQGEPRKIPADEIRAAPGRYLLARTPRVFLKVLDLEDHAQRPILRNLAAVRLLP